MEGSVHLIFGYLCPEKVLRIKNWQTSLVLCPRYHMQTPTDSWCGWELAAQCQSYKTDNNTNTIPTVQRSKGRHREAEQASDLSQAGVLAVVLTPSQLAVDFLLHFRLCNRRCFVICLCLHSHQHLLNRRRIPITRQWTWKRNISSFAIFFVCVCLFCWFGLLACLFVFN